MDMFVLSDLINNPPQSIFIVLYLAFIYDVYFHYILLRYSETD